MKLMKTETQQTADLYIVLTVLIFGIVFSLFSTSVNLLDRLYNFFSAYITLPLAKLLIHIVFVLLVCLLWITYRRWKKAIQGQEELEEIIGSISTDVFIVVDSTGTIVMCNAAVKKMFGYEPDEIISRKASFLFFEKGPDGERGGISQVFKKDDMRIELSTGKKKDGEAIPLEIVAGKLKVGHGAVLLLRDITERKKAEETIKNLAYHDSLTGLPNILFFNHRFLTALTNAERIKQKLALLLLDLDYFKRVNDTMGHSAGDKLLQMVGKRLKSALRADDTVARMGGDEFMVLLPVVTEAEKAGEVAGKILKKVRKPLRLEDRELSITASLGIAIYPDDGKDIDTLRRSADIAMYGVKRRGRDGYQRYSPQYESSLPK